MHWAAWHHEQWGWGLQQQAKSALKCNPKGILEINELVCHHFV